MEGNRGRAFQYLSDEEIQGLVDSLNSLHEGELGVDMLVACGPRAIEPLRRFLLYGKPSGIFVPRQRALGALAGLGAKDVLLEYLASERRIADPVAAHGEEAVRNTAARALAAWQTEDVYDGLLHALRRKRLTGVIETLGEFRRPETVPDLVAALEDDFCRSSAEEALQKSGEPAHCALIEAARTPDPSGTTETTSSRNRRRCALRLLGGLQLSIEDWEKVAALLHDKDPEIVARAGSIALAVADETDKKLAVRRLIEVLPAAHWLLQGEIEGWLEDHFVLAQPSIDEEIERRQTAPVLAQFADDVLRLLLSIEDRARKRLA